jgi:hypothetical protein
MGMKNLEELTDQEIIAAERIVILQNFAETFVALHGAQSSEEVFEKADVYGELNEEQARLLRLYLKEELAGYGLDLKYYVTSRGEQYEPGKLSKAEIALLMKKADEMIVFLSTLQERKNKAMNIANNAVVENNEAL